MALLRLTDAPSLAPRARVAFASWGVRGSIDGAEAAGFPEAWRTEAEPTREYTLEGKLRIAAQRGPYAWTVQPGDKPDKREGWTGMSGGAVCVVGTDILHILGVLQEVPGNFSGGQLSVARLSFAFADGFLWNRVRDALGHEPRLVPWNGDSPSAPMPFHSTIDSLRGRPFVGREDLLESVGAALGDPTRESIVVLKGPAGVGKSELAQEFARRNQAAYPGGTFLLDAGGPSLATGFARLGQIVPRLKPPDGLTIESQGEWVLHNLGPAPTLLIYDNAPFEAAIEVWLPRAGMACHVLVTTLLDRWDVGWQALDVAPLSPRRSRSR